MVTAIETTFEFKLPEHLEARKPPEARGLQRDEVRLMVSDRRTDRIVHTNFTDLADFLDPTDVLVVNVSQTIPAILPAAHNDSSRFDLNLSTQLSDGIWVVEPRHTHVVAGERVTLPEGAAAAFLTPHRGSPRLWLAALDLGDEPFDYIHRWGKPIKYQYVDEEWPLDYYQTVYAKTPGSAEMPSAGRAFSPRVLDSLRARGVTIAEITLHTGVASLEKDEPPYEEWYEVPAETVERIAEAKRSGGRVIAVGTTVVRALESSLDAESNLIASQGWTDLLITPQRGVQVIDGLLTGFHEPRATHLAMLEAIAGHDHIASAYDAALGAAYLWHEFGDLHLIL